MSETLWAAATGLIPTVGAGLWVAWRWWFDRHDKHEETAISREERLQRDLEAQRVALSKEQTDLFDRVRAELVRLTSHRDEAEREMERWAWLARWWFDRYHDLFRAYRDLAHDTNRLLHWLGFIRERYPDLSPPEVTPVPPRQEPPMSVEEPLREKDAKA